MTGFKGSQGVWSVNEELDVVCAGKYVALISLHDGESTRRANAKLIAAAPELLEACLRIQAQFRQAGIESKAGSLNPIEDNAAQIDAVILKALGR